MLTSVDVYKQREENNNNNKKKKSRARDVGGLHAPRSSRANLPFKLLNRQLFGMEIVIRCTRQTSRQVRRRARLMRKYKGERTN